MMWTQRLRPRSDDTNIPRKKYKSGGPPDDCSQKQDNNLQNSSSEQNKNPIIGPPRDVCASAKTVTKPEDIDKQLQEDITIQTNTSDIFPEESKITPDIFPEESKITSDIFPEESKITPDISPPPSTLVNKISPTILEKLLVTPEQNNEIKISETGDDDVDFNVIVELVDHTADYAIINESQATPASAVSSEIIEELSDSETEGSDEELKPTDQSSSELDLTEKTLQADKMYSKISDASTSRATGDLTTEGCKNETYGHILRSSKVAIMTAFVEEPVSNSAPQFQMKPNNSDNVDKQNMKAKPQVVEEIIPTENCSRKREVIVIPKFRPWPRATQGPYLGAFKPHDALTLKNPDFCKQKSIFLDSSLKEIDKKWKVRLVDKGDNYGSEWNMFQLFGNNHMTEMQETAIDDIARKLHHKNETGARILHLSEHIFRHLLAEGMEQPVVEVIVHHSEEETTPATAWILRQNKNRNIYESQFETDYADILERNAEEGNE